jgi:hypothetical protein
LDANYTELVSTDHAPITQVPQRPRTYFVRAQFNY